MAKNGKESKQTSSGPTQRASNSKITQEEANRASRIAATVRESGGFIDEMQTAGEYARQLRKGDKKSLDELDPLTNSRNLRENAAVGERKKMEAAIAKVKRNKK